MNTATKWVVGLFCILKLALHLLADSNSGFQIDELLHIATGKHLAFGFMEFPPLIAVLAFLQNLFQSQSVFVHHLFSHAASLLIVVFVAKITVELGGKAKAVFLVLLCILIAPAFGRSQQLFQPVVFSQFFWVLNFYWFTKYVKYRERKHLWLLTLGTALAFLTKYDAVFFAFGVASLLLFQTTRRSLFQHKFWIHILVFILLISPNIIWQFTHDFPVFKMFDRLYETQLNQQSPLEILQDLILALNPLTLLISGAALVALFHASFKSYRPLAAAILLATAFLALSQGKDYYYYSIVVTLFPFGGVFWEQQCIAKRKWLLYPLSGILLVGSALIPFGLPVVPLDTYVETDYPYENREVLAGGEYSIAFDERYSKEKWATTLGHLQEVYTSLPDSQKRNTLIWGKHYAQAGAVSLFGEQYGLPAAFSLHGSFYSWLPEGELPETTIALSYEVGDFFNVYFDEVLRLKSIYNPYSETAEEQQQHIYICRKPKYNFEELRMLFKERVFE